MSRSSPLNLLPRERSESFEVGGDPERPLGLPRLLFAGAGLDLVPPLRELVVGEDAIHQPVELRVRPRTGVAQFPEHFPRPPCEDFPKIEVNLLVRESCVAPEPARRDATRHPGLAGQEFRLYLRQQQAIAAARRDPVTDRAERASERPARWSCLEVLPRERPRGRPDDDIRAVRGDLGELERHSGDQPRGNGRRELARPRHGSARPAISLVFASSRAARRVSASCALRRSSGVSSCSGGIGTRCPRSSIATNVR